ncbi:hypothetical protein NCC78_12600 [Micromonospora phytophila]|nr:hypothetical protein [Micromonospora phytophila]MCM0675524.1 hypothetical protein [Micromonospora phytophila]
MPVSALDQHLKGICRPSAHPEPALPDRGVPGQDAATRRPETESEAAR